MNSFSVFLLSVVDADADADAVTVTVCVCVCVVGSFVVIVLELSTDVAFEFEVVAVWASPVATNTSAGGCRDLDRPRTTGRCGEGSFCRDMEL